MNAVNQMPYMLTGMEMAFPTQTQPQTAQGSESNKFESVLREKHQETTGKNVRKDTKDGADKTQGESAKADEDVPEEQYVLAAAMMMQPRPEILFIQPEQTVEDGVLTEEVIPETAGEQLHVTEILPEDAQETVAQQSDFAPEVEKSFEETAIPTARNTTEPKADAEQTDEFQSIQTLDTAEKPQAKEQSQAKLDTRPQTRMEEQPEEDAEDDAEISGAWSEPVFSHLDAAPVKVAAPEKPVNMQAPDAAEQLSERLTDAVENGLEQIQIRLSPEGLGEVNVMISRADNGALKILMIAEPKAINLLMQHTNDLQHSMSNVMRGEVQIEVREPQNSQQQQLLNPDGQQNRDQREQQRQHQERQKQVDDDFLQKLRLGLTDLTLEV